MSDPKNEENNNAALNAPVESAWKPMMILLVPFVLVIIYGALT